MLTISSSSFSSRRINVASLLVGLSMLSGFALTVVGLWVVSTYKRLVSSEQEVRARWAEVEDAYQRRADLVPSVVATVKGAAAFEPRPFTAVTEARACMALEDPKAFERFETAQAALGSELHRLLALSESSPDLEAIATSRDLQAQLARTENRITVERRRFIEAARDFNALRSSFPESLVASGFGGRFEARPRFSATPATASAP